VKKIRGSERRDRLWELLLGVGLVLLGVILTIVYTEITKDPPEQLPTPPTINTRFFAPDFAAGGGNAISIDRARDGRCADRSLVNPETRTARLCEEQDGRVHDPCYAIRGGVRMYQCFTNPWAYEQPDAGPGPRGIAIYATGKRRLPPDPWKGEPGYRAWALKLDNGSWCILDLMNTRAFPESVYECADNHTAGSSVTGWVTSFPDDRQPIWTVQYVAAGGAVRGSETARVVQAWR
jgi:hypothetical protein